VHSRGSPNGSRPRPPVVRVPIPLQLGKNKKPFNPVMGEMYIARSPPVEGQEVYYFSEQVSHHPPGMAIHYVAPAKNISLTGTFFPKGTFTGTGALHARGGLAGRPAFVRANCVRLCENASTFASASHEDVERQQPYSVSGRVRRRVQVFVASALPARHVRSATLAMDAAAIADRR